MSDSVNVLPARTPHKIFSPARVAAIASNTLLELVRLKVFYFLLIFALLIIAASGFTSVFELQFQGEFQILKDMSLGAMSIFTLLLSILTTSAMLPKDIEDRTLYTILAKPVPRVEYLMGKLAGVFLLLLISVLVMSAMFVAALYAKQQWAIAATMHNGALTPEQMHYGILDIKAHTFTMSLVPCITLIYLTSALMASLTLLISTFATSSIFTIFIATTAYFIGNVESVAREYYYSQTSVSQVAKIFLTALALFFPDLQLFNLIDDIVAGNAIATTLFLKTAGLGCVYVTVYSFVAYVIFAFKEL